MRAAIYLRISTDEQTTDNQERELRATAERASSMEAVGEEHDAVIRSHPNPGPKAFLRKVVNRWISSGMLSLV